MKPSSLRVLLLAILVICPLALAQNPYSMQTAAPPADLPKPLAEALVPQGVRLMSMENGLSTVVCEVWWTRSVVGHVAAGKVNPQYGNLTPGALVGVLHFITEGEDSRDQKLQPGFYTLRYANVPPDPEHSDTGLPQDAVLVSPVWADKHIDETLKPGELTKLSSLATKTKNPAVMNLMPVNPAYKDSPVIITDDQGNCSLQIKMKLRSAAAAKQQDFPLAILLVTPVRENGES